MVFNSANTVSWPRRRVLMRQPLLVQHQNETTTLPSEFATLLRFKCKSLKVRTLQKHTIVCIRNDDEEPENNHTISVASPSDQYHIHLLVENENAHNLRCGALISSPEKKPSDDRYLSSESNSLSPKSDKSNP